MGKILKKSTQEQFAQIKEEISGLKQEKEDAYLTMQDQKKKLMYDKEEITITRMLNIETGR
jgi:ABC-type phosphate transport system auxiliary subunit